MAEPLSKELQLNLKIHLENLTILFKNTPLVSKLPRVFLVVSHAGLSTESKSGSLVQSHQSPGTFGALWSNAVIPMTIGVERNKGVFVFSPKDVTFELKGRMLGQLQPEPELLARFTFPFADLKQENLSASEAIERKSLDMMLSRHGPLSESRSIVLQAMFQYRLQETSPNTYVWICLYVMWHYCYLKCTYMPAHCNTEVMWR